MEYEFFDPILDMDGVLEFVSPSHSENGLTDYKVIGIDERMHAYS